METGFQLSSRQAYKLERLFVKYCTYGTLWKRSMPPSSSSTELSGLNFEKYKRMLLDLGLEELVRKGQCSVIFSSCCSSQDRMTFEEFVQSLGLVALGVYPEEVNFPTAVHRLLENYLLAKKAKLHRKTQTQTRNAEEDKDGRSFSTSMSTTSTFHTFQDTCSSTTSRGTCETIPSECLPGKRNQLRLNDVMIKQLKGLYNYYAHHWCTCRSTDSGGSRKKWVWTEKLCIGGFRVFVFDSRLFDSDGESPPLEIVDNVFSMSCQGKSRLSFKEFVGGVANLASELHQNNSFVFQTSMKKLFQDMVHFYHCIPHEPPPLIQSELLPFECREDETVKDLLVANLPRIRAIFSHYADMDLNDEEENVCLGGGVLDMAHPSISSENFLKFALDFDLAPHFLRLNQLSSLFVALGAKQDEEISTRPKNLRRSLTEFVALLLHCALTGLSKFPHGSRTSTAMEKLQLLLQRMLLSKGMSDVFGPIPPKFSGVHPTLSRQHKHEDVAKKKACPVNPSSPPVRTTECETVHVSKDLTPLKAVQALDFFNETLRAAFTASASSNPPTPKPRSRKNPHAPSVHDENFTPLYRIPSDFEPDRVQKAQTRQIWTGDPKHYPHQPRTPVSPNAMSQPIRALRFPKHSTMSSQENLISRKTSFPSSISLELDSSEIKDTSIESLSLEEKIAKALQLS